LLPGTFAGNRLKKLVKREGIYEPEMLVVRSEEGEIEGNEEGSGERSEGSEEDIRRPI
jgi:hypothetical protein